MEVQLFEPTRDLFDVALGLVFWDTTYFEGDELQSFAEYRFSKDSQPDRFQVIIGGLKTRDGTPVAYKVLKTVQIELDRQTYLALTELQ